MKALRIKDIEKHSDQWVALDKGGTKIVSAGKSFKDVLENASKKVKKPIMMRVPRLDASFAP